MKKTQLPLGAEAEEFLAEITSAAYGVALKHGLRGSFLDIQLDLWTTLRKVVQGKSAGSRNTEGQPCRL